jgi:hypothetical protein
MHERTIDDIFRRDFDSLPLPPRGEWLPVVSRRRWLRALAAIPVLAVALVVAFIVAQQLVSYRAAQQDRSSVGAAPSAPSLPTATLDPAVLGGARSAVIARIRALSGEVSRVDRIEAKLMRRSDFETRVQPSGSAQFDGSRWIWAVAVAGEIRPQFGHGTTFSWGIFLVDAQNGDILGLVAGAGTWPTYFDALPDALPNPKEAAAGRSTPGPQPTPRRFAAGSPTAVFAGLDGDPDFAQMIVRLTNGPDADPRAVGRIVVPGIPVFVRGLGSNALDEYVIPLLVDNTTIAIVWTPIDRDGLATLGGMAGWSNAPPWPQFDAGAARVRGSTSSDAVIGAELVWANAPPGFTQYNPFWKLTRSSGDVLYLFADGTLVSARVMPIP